MLKRKPDHVEAQANLGVVLARMGKTDEAIIAYETALKLAPHLTPIYLNLGILYFRINEFEKAINTFDKFLETNPSHLQARQLLGLSLVEISYNTAAIEQLVPTLAVAPNDPAILYSLGLAYIRTNQLKEAEGLIQKLAVLPTGLAVSHLLKGQLQLARFEFEKAIIDLKKAGELNPELPRLHYSIGLCYYKLGLNKAGLSAFEAEVKQRPKDFTTLYYLALLHEAEGNLDPAKQYVDLALAMQPNSVEVITILGKVLSRQGKNAEAAIAIEKAVAQDPKDSLKHYLLGKIYRELGRRDDSNREFNEARRLKAEETQTDRNKPAKP
ncbi:MAG: tetratricopeptide repeat protein [Blastocatellia bacterium]|nr:tetratricopeptide repeat protein [Blastocatellia bacterium]